MRRAFACLAVVVAVLSLAGSANAGIPDPDNSFVAVGPDGGMTTCPSGDGPTFQYVTVTAMRSDMSPIQGIPSSSFFFTITGGDVQRLAVDSETDFNGEIRFELLANESIVGTITIECQIYTVVLNDSDSVDCISLDVNEDGHVGLQDYTLFSADYGGVEPRSDFDWSGGVDQPDFDMLIEHYGHVTE
ncbi:MAG: hypothetical protein ABIE42_06180 [Candidatus Eisenbacteria bacterium]